MPQITLNDTTVKKLDGSSILIATLLSNGTVFVSSTSFPRKYLSDLTKDFSALSPIFIELGSFRDDNTANLIHGWKNPKDGLSKAIRQKRSLYQWRYRFSIMGAKIIDRNGESPYVVSTPSQQKESGASQTIFQWLEKEARDLPLCPEIVAWAERCNLSVPTWATWENESKRDLFLDLIGNKENYADHLVQNLIELSFSDNMKSLIQSLLDEEYMAISVCLIENDDENKHFIIVKIKREQRCIIDMNSLPLDESVNEDSGAFRWLNRDLLELQRRGGKYYKFTPKK